MAEHRRNSLTCSITRRHHGSLAEDRFMGALKETGASWITVLREMGPLTGHRAFRPVVVDIYVSTGQNETVHNLAINIAFQNFASTLKPHNVNLHLIPSSQVATDVLKNHLRNPQGHNPIVWEERLTQNG